MEYRPTHGFICHLSNGVTLLHMKLYVRNRYREGLSHRPCWELVWSNDKRYLIPAIGYCSNFEFKRERDAIAYGERQGWGKAERWLD